MSRPSFKYGNPDSLWAFYNHVTLALQQSHPKTWMEDQRVLHWFISDAFKFDKAEEVEPEVDPNQVDLEDMIAEVEAEEETTVTEATEVEVTPEPTIEEQIAEDEAAVAKVCDEPQAHPWAQMI